MKVKGFLFVVVLAAVLAVGGGCGKKGQEESKGKLFGVTFQTMNNPFFVDLNDGLKEIIEANGDRLVTLDAQWNSLKQRNDISDLIMQGASAIFINPVNWKGIKGSLLQAKEKGIPCIVVDAPAQDIDLVLCTVASDNVEAGRLAAQALAEVCRPAKIVILHLHTNKACIDRVEGFTQEIAKYSDMLRSMPKPHARTGTSLPISVLVTSGRKRPAPPSSTHSFFTGCQPSTSTLGSVYGKCPGRTLTFS